VRTFIAVDLPSELKKKIDEICTFFRQKTPERALKWVSAEHLHLTIKFIGEINESKIVQVKDAMEHALIHQTTFEFQVSGMGIFPNHKVPRIIWLGIIGVEPLTMIHRNLDKELAKLEIQPETRPFSPHLTLARVRKNVDPAVLKTIGATLSQFKVDAVGTAVVHAIHLYQSELTPSGPLYTLLHSVPLNQV
jgi:RNA 2',3'-cyclic 3'-phosphodiesterase